MKKEFVTDCGGIKAEELEERGIPKEIEEKVKNKNNTTELVFILDKSGSMAGMEKDTIGGFNAMIERQKGIAGEVYVSTVLFSSWSEVLHDRKRLEEIEPLTEKDYRVGGCTALSRKYSPMAHPEYGARNCRGAGSEAVAATRMEYSKAFASERI